MKIILIRKINEMYFNEEIACSFLIIYMEYIIIFT